MKVEDIFKKISESDDISHVTKNAYDDTEMSIKRATLRKLELENDAKEGENQSDAQDREQRKEFADKIFNFVKNYMIFVCIILFFNAITPQFHLSDMVLVTLLGTTTANVIGILIIVVTYLFSRKRK